jgi:hypothetical protein
MRLSELKSLLLTAAMLFSFVLQASAQQLPGGNYVGPAPTIVNKGNPCVGNATGSGCATSGAYIDVTVFIPTSYTPGGTSDYCNPVGAMTAAGTAGNMYHFENLPPTVACNSLWIAAGGSFSGVLYPGTTTFMVNSNSGAQAIPGTTHVYGAGKSSGAALFTASSGTVIAACQSGVTSATILANICGGTSFVPSKTTDGNNYGALMCLSNLVCSAGTSGGSNGFDAQVWGMTLSCSYIPNCVDFANYWMQNLSGLFRSAVNGCSYTNNICVDLGGGIGQAQESTVSDLFIYNPGITGCNRSPTAVGVRVWTTGGSNGAPFSIQDVTVVDNCSNGTNMNDLIEIANNTGGIRISDIHGESGARCMICIGLYSNMSTGTEVDTGAVAGQILIENVDAGPGFGTTGVGTILIASTANYSGASVGNVTIMNTRQSSSTAPQYLVYDQTSGNTPILASSNKFVGLYGIRANGTVWFDSTQTNTSNLGPIAALLNGNTYPASGGFTSGGIPCFTSTSVEGSSTLLATGQLLLGGGSGACPTSASGTSVSNTAIHAGNTFQLTSGYTNATTGLTTVITSPTIAAGAVVSFECFGLYGVTGTAEQGEWGITASQTPQAISYGVMATYTAAGASNQPAGTVINGHIIPAGGVVASTAAVYPFDLKGTIQWNASTPGTFAFGAATSNVAGTMSIAAYSAACTILP